MSWKATNGVTLDGRDTVLNESESLKRVKEAVPELAPNAEVTLYGSRARGTTRRDCD